MVVCEKRFILAKKLQNTSEKVRATKCDAILCEQWTFDVQVVYKSLF